MVLDYQFLSEKEVHYILKLTVDEDKRFLLDYNQILNGGKERDGAYVFNVDGNTVKIDKITGEVI